MTAHTRGSYGTGASARVALDSWWGDGEVGKSVSVDLVRGIRERLMPMLRHVAEEYRDRTPDGYPVVVDAPDRGLIGIELDPSYALYVTSDGSQLSADFYFRSARTDARSSASREKFGGVPFEDRRPIDAAISDQALRNLIAELISRWNFQPTIIHITDT